MHWSNSSAHCILRQFASAELGAALLAIATASCILAFSSGGAAAQQLSVGVLKGQLGTTRSDGVVVPPDSATVYVLFSPMTNPHPASPLYDVDTAGGQFMYLLNNLLARDKELKNLTKSARKNPGPVAADQIAARYLRSVDDALTQARDWMTKHPDRTWQMATAAADERGFWTVEALRPGEYEVVARGKILGNDADWESGANVEPRRTNYLPLIQPRFFRLSLRVGSH